MESVSASDDIGMEAFRTIENAATLPKKFERETASGVRRVTSLMGITGYGAQYDSTITNSAQSTALLTRRPQITGCDQGISSVDFRLMPNRRQPTVPTKVKEPKPSMRLSLVRIG
ncbi:hypothetical protein PHLCEN_2v10553 [Hermanssonia centrifuga]|uniref:Uncharacterized protein n=1 Tax=Hermanssonia centrifuga TaxID=98765 RepID=A0A2R6NMM0_9APHY|nr:hypothetical protein PHLCEN_2v10553 [Hermanssonia centrifuga]